MGTKGKSPKEAGRCVFCGGTGLTKEHIWSDWLSEVIPAENQHVQTGLYMRVNNESKTAIVDPHILLDRQGPVNSRKIRNVCTVCNSGWMSAIVNAARPFATHLIRDECVTLDVNAQKALSTWITIACIMAEYTDKKSAGIPAVDRELVWRTSNALPNWTICLGRYHGKEWTNVAYRHHGAKFFNLIPGTRRVESSDPHYLQVSTYTLGSLLIQAFSSTDSGCINNFRRNWIPSEMVRIWPISLNLIPVPLSLPQFLDDDAVDTIADLFIRSWQ